MLHCPTIPLEILESAAKSIVEIPSKLIAICGHVSHAKPCSTVKCIPHWSCVGKEEKKKRSEAKFK